MLEAFEEFLAGHVARVKFREIVLDGSITEPTEDTATPVVLFNGDNAEIGLAEIINVAIDMIRHHAIGDTTQPCIRHEPVNTVGATVVFNVGVVLPLAASTTGVEGFAVGVFLPEVDTTIAQPKLGEGIHATSLREEETDTVIRLAKACAVTEDQLTMVVRIELKPQEWLWLPWFSLLATQLSLPNPERFTAIFLSPSMRGTINYVFH